MNDQTSQPYTYKEFKSSLGPSKFGPQRQEARHVYRILMGHIRNAIKSPDGCEKKVLIHAAIAIGTRYNLETFCDYADEDYLKLRNQDQGRGPQNDIVPGRARANENWSFLVPGSTTGYERRAVPRTPDSNLTLFRPIYECQMMVETCLIPIRAGAME